jgi:hypothetical protein
MNAEETDDAVLLTDVSSTKLLMFRYNEGKTSQVSLRFNSSAACSSTMYSRINSITLLAQTVHKGCDRSSRVLNKVLENSGEQTCCTRVNLKSSNPCEREMTTIT